MMGCALYNVSVHYVRKRNSGIKCALPYSKAKQLVIYSTMK